MTLLSVRPAALQARDGRLVRHGIDHRVLSGSIHYFRVHPAHWRDRLERLAALGLNTVDTYVPWNFHQPRPDVAPDFTGWRDVETFIRTAADLGLDVIVRPGPYICAEWDNGGFPSWVTDRVGREIRSSAPRFLSMVAEWFDALVPRIAALQAAAGGPVVAVQVENEFGSFGDDPGYLRWIRNALLSRGITELLYTADGPMELMLDGGTVPGTLAAATFGSRAAEAAALLASRRGGEPFFCAEYWNGWFDHWGEHHHIRSADSAATSLADILAAGGSVSIYMAHGGTNFGLWAGANHDGTRIQPTVTSYDSDAPIAENGAVTPKYLAFRDQLAVVTGRPFAPVPAQPAVLTPRSFPVVRGGGLLPVLRGAGRGMTGVTPARFSDVGLDSGLMLYRARPRLPHGPVSLSVTGLHDRAQVFVDGAAAGILEADGVVELVGAGMSADLELLVENQGRVNYGALLGQDKGILGGVQLERRRVQGWESIPLDLAAWSDRELEAGLRSWASEADAPGFVSAGLHLDEPADAFLALPGFAKGFVWVNGFLIGRYWERGPQRTLYVPGPLLKAGANRFVVLELERAGGELRLAHEPDLGPRQEFVGTF